jgi:hypothetical protein
MMEWDAAQAIRAAAPELGRSGSRSVLQAALAAIERAGWVVRPKIRDDEPCV